MTTTDKLREVQKECDCCVDGLQADGETPCPYCIKPAIPVADAAEALLEAHKSGAWVIGRGRTVEQVAMIISALRAALSTPTEGEAQPLDDATQAVLDRAERIVAGQSQQEKSTAEIFLRPTEGEA